MTGAEVRNWRERHGMTQVELAEALDIPCRRLVYNEYQTKVSRMMELALDGLHSKINNTPPVVEI